MAYQNIPILDLASYIKGNEKQKTGFEDAIGHAYENIGFVSITNHGIDPVLVHKFYQLTQAYYALPAEVKKRYEIDGMAGQRGYTSFGIEKAKGGKMPDLKEFWQIGPEVLDNDPIKQFYPGNIEVHELPDFNATGVALFREFETAGKTLLGAIASYLGLKADFFDKGIYNGNSILRSIHYPPIIHEPESAIRSEKHEDINLITLLVGASAGGLEVLNRDNEWIPAIPASDAIVVNVGDMLQRLTNDRLRSTTHRVVNPPKEKWHTHRFSIPFFLHPRTDMPLNVLDVCINENHPKKYSDITAGEYLDERLIEIGLKKV